MTDKKTTEDEDLLAGSTGSRAEGDALPGADTETLEKRETLPQTQAPNQTVPEGKVEVETVKGAAQKKVRRTRTAPPTPKKDIFVEHDHTIHEKLPLSVAVGDTVIQVVSAYGVAVASISLKGWIGNPDFQVPLEQLPNVETALAELRKQLSA